MGRIVIALARGAVLALVALSAIVSLYEATNAVAVYTNHTIFTSGLLMTVAAALLNPLFCFIANYGLVRYEDVPLGLALTLTMPAFVAWCVIAGRGLLAMTSR